MTTMISEVYDALKDAQGVSDEKARRAAEAIAQFDSRFTELKVSIDAFRADTNTKFEAVNTKIEVLRGEMNAKFEAQSGEMNARFAAQSGEMNARFSAQDGRINLIWWQLTLLIGGVVALVLKAFLP